MFAHHAPRLSLILLLALVMFGQDCPSSGPPEGSEFLDYDVTDYAYTFDIASGQSRSVVSFDALTEGNCVSLDYRVPGDGSEPLWNGAPAEWYAYGSEVLEVCGAALVRPGEHITVATDPGG